MPSPRWKLAFNASVAGGSTGAAATASVDVDVVDDGLHDGLQVSSWHLDGQQHGCLERVRSGKGVEGLPTIGALWRQRLALRAPLMS